MIDFLFNTKGRISRKGYLLAYFLPYIALTEIIPRFLGAVAPAVPGLGLLFLVIGVFYLWPSIVAVPVRRFHDMGLSGWFHAGVLALGLIALIIMMQGLFAEIGDMEQFMALSQAEQQEVVTAALQTNGRVVLGQALAMGVFFLEFLLFAIKPGTAGPNKFGNDPLESGRGYAD